MQHLWSRWIGNVLGQDLPQTDCGRWWGTEGVKPEEWWGSNMSGECRMDTGERVFFILIGRWLDNGQR